MSAAEQRLATWLADLAARQSTPGGGGAAGLAAAVGAAVGQWQLTILRGKSGLIVRHQVCNSSNALIRLEYLFTGHR